MIKKIIKKKKKELFKRKLPKSAGIYFERELLESPAFWELNATAIRVLICFYLKRDIRTIITAIKNDTFFMFS